MTQFPTYWKSGNKDHAIKRYNTLYFLPFVVLSDHFGFHNGQHCFTVQLHASGSDLKLCDSSELKNHLKMRGLGPDGVSNQAHQG